MAKLEEISKNLTKPESEEFMKHDFDGIDWEGMTVEEGIKMARKVMQLTGNYVEAKKEQQELWVEIHLVGGDSFVIPITEACITEEGLNLQKVTEIASEKQLVFINQEHISAILLLKGE